VTPQLLLRGKVLVALGANCPGPWGTPAETIAHALGRIEQANVALRAVSPLYETRAVGNARQPAYVNAVALLETALSPESLLRVLKRIERESGRRGESTTVPLRRGTLLPGGVSSSPTKL